MCELHWITTRTVVFNYYVHFLHMDIFLAEILLDICVYK